MVLYRLVAGHVPITTNSNIKPYVPSNRLAGEEAYTPRICVSQSLNGCLTSIGPAAIGTAAILHELCGTSSLCPEEQTQILDRLAFPYTILTFDIPADAPYLIQASQLENEVADAGITKECWLTKTCRPSSVSHQWFIDGTIEIQHLAFHNQKRPYCIIRNSVWSKSPKHVNAKLKKQILMITKAVLFADRWLMGQHEFVEKIKTEDKATTAISV